MTRKQIGARIRKARLAEGLTHLELSHRIRDLGLSYVNVDPSKLSRMENGQSPTPFPVLAAIARALGVAVTDLDPDAVVDLTKSGWRRRRRR